MDKGDRWEDAVESVQQGDEFIVRPRAHRIEVDHCGECPFIRDQKTRPNRARCAHPAKRSEVLIVRNPPPAWCPLRGAVTMIAGPRP